MRLVLNYRNTDKRTRIGANVLKISCLHTKVETWHTSIYGMIINGIMLRLFLFTSWPDFTFVQMIIDTRECKYLLVFESLLVNEDTCSLLMDQAVINKNDTLNTCVKLRVDHHYIMYT